MLEASGIDPQHVAPVNQPFAIGDVQLALEATPPEIADQIVVAGTPEEWASWLSDTYAPAGLYHAPVSFADPFTLKAWAGMEVADLPDLGAGSPGRRAGPPRAADAMNVLRRSPGATGR